MSLAERVKIRPEDTSGIPCSVAALIDSLSGDELAALQQIMYGKAGLSEPSRNPKVRGWTERAVFEAVIGEGYAVAKNQINEHRGKRCRCYRDAA